MSFAHGSNDGQKGMGLVMLILVGTVPMAYALNRSMPASHVMQFAAVAEVAHQALDKAAPGPVPADPRAVLSEYVRTRTVTAQVLPALSAVSASIGEQVRQHGSLAKMPATAVSNVRSSGVAGTMAANGSWLQLSSIRNIAIAWVLTLPAAMLLSGSLYWVFSAVF